MGIPVPVGMEIPVPAGITAGFAGGAPKAAGAVVFALDDAKFTVLGTVEKGDSTAAGLAMATGSGMFIVVWLIGVEKDASDDKPTAIGGPDSS